MTNLTSRVHARRVSYRFALLCFSALAGLIGFGVFCRPTIGLADNGDFGKVTGGECLVPIEDPAYDSSYNSVVLYWRVDQTRCWSNPIPTVEKVFIRIAVVLQRLAESQGVFDIRSIGMIHFFLYALGLWNLFDTLRCLPLSVWTATFAYLVLVISDIAYIAYFCSFYTDAAAISAMPGFVASIWAALSPLPARPHAALWLVLFGPLVICSKGQHASLGLVVVAMLALAHMVMRRPPGRILVTIYLVVATSSVGMIQRLPLDYKADSLFSIVFFEILGRSESVNDDLRDLGLKPEHLQAKGMYAFENRWPANDSKWKVSIYEQIGFVGLARFYIRHPIRTFNIIQRSLEEYLKDVRPLLLANYSRSQGFHQGDQSSTFSYWSRWRSLLYARTILMVPIVLVFGLIAAFCCFWVGRKDAGMFMLTLEALAVTSMLTATLADAVETSRHLTLFHQMFDYLIGATLPCIHLAWMASNHPGAKSLRSDGA